jgi:hypothetical protein
LISITSTSAKGTTVTGAQSSCIGVNPSLNDSVVFSDRIGNKLQVDAHLMYLGLVQIAKHRDVKVVDIIEKISKLLEENTVENAE